MRVLPVLILLLLPLLAAPARADYAAGKRAYDAEDYPTALAELRPAAEAGDPRAQYWLADMYRFGLGGPTDHAAALRWYRLAARQTSDVDINRRAVYALGYMVNNALGVDRDVVRAGCLYRNAAENGYVSAQWGLCRLISRESELLGRKMVSIGVDMCHRAAEQGDSYALAFLSDIMLWNPLTPDEKGYMYLVLSAQRGVDQSREKVAEFERTLKGREREQFEAGVEMAKTWRAREEPMPDKPFPLDTTCLP
ncbi:MAG: sel1 repeat family protein [Rhodobacterales bacterium]|nr:sel1 repeat family protein [Rhodobacterales bacterium]